MSIFKRAAKAVKRTATKAVKATERPFTKQGIRNQMKVAAKVGKVAVPIASAAVTYLAGPVVGEAFAYGGSQLVGYSQKTGNRSEIKGHEASMEARKVQQRTFKYAQFGVGVGAAASAAVAVAGGSSVLGTAGKVVAGQAGSNLLGWGSGPQVNPTSGPPLNPYPVEYGTLGDAEGIGSGFQSSLSGGSSVPGLSTSLDMAPSSGGVPGLVTSYGSGISPGGGSFLQSLGGFATGIGGAALGAAGKILPDYLKAQAQKDLTPGERSALADAARAAGFDPGSLGLGGDTGSGGMQGGDLLKLALIAGGVFLLAKAA